MTHLASIADEVRVNERTLRRAVNEGALRAVRPSPRTLEISISELQYVRRSWPLISALREALRTEPNVRFALLFGSVARGTDTPASDIDIAVALRDDSFDRTLDLARKLTAIVGRQVDVVRIGDAQHQPGLLAEIANDGRVLVDRDGSSARLRKQRSTFARRARDVRSEQVRAALSELDHFLTADGSSSAE